MSTAKMHITIRGVTMVFDVGGFPYYQVDVEVGGTRGTLTLERNGEPLSGGNQVSDWASISLRGYPIDVLDEIRALALPRIKAARL